MIDKKHWWIFRGNKSIIDLPPPPPWRFKKSGNLTKSTSEEIKPPNKNSSSYIIDEDHIDVINAAIYLRRPLLITGKPGTGKSSLAEAIAYELGLGNVIKWPITTQTTLKDGLYRYDAIARLQDVTLKRENPELHTNDDKDKDLSIKNYLRLGPLGSAFASSHFPKVILIDEIDKSDIDLPNNLLHILEEGEFEIPELSRLSNKIQSIFLHNEDTEVSIEKGIVPCDKFPIIIMTSNAEREFPPAFMRRCLTLNMTPPNEEKLGKIVSAHISSLPNETKKVTNKLIETFLKKRDEDRLELSTDQLLNTIYLVMNSINIHESDHEKLLERLWKSLLES